MQVVILAGGLATRLGEITRNCPKSMVRIQGKPFLEYQLNLLKRKGIEDVILCTGYLGEQIEDYFESGKEYGMNISYSCEDEPLGTAGALKNAEPILKDVFFTIYGDSFISLDFSRVMSYFNSQNKLALMTVYKNYNRYDKSNTEIEGNLVKRYSKKEKSDKMVYIDYGVNIFRKKALNMIPTHKFYSLDNLFPRLIEKHELLAFEVMERFYEIGSLQGLEEFTNFVGGGVR
jgi:MurNAc alpha-1-phosphate uridylyltransferase